MSDADLALALSLQAEFDQNSSASSTQDLSSENKYPSSHPKSIVDPAWELLDPHPDIRSMFHEFNRKYFWGKLCMVEVKWSPRMTLCAGVCSYEGRGGLCSIRLSEPLLSLRPRKDLVETLLHEMIHALLFVTENNTDHDGHGPNFCEHMKRINRETGSNISIYHNFHDEVNQMRKHWWRCDGTCRSRPPYFGYVRRAMNRAPAPRDPWWPEHQRTCGGTYIKVKEPENYKKKPVKANKTREAIPSSSKPAKSKESADEGHRLGGNIPVNRSIRGIPEYSRLLQDSKIPSTSSPFSKGAQNISSENRSMSYKKCRSGHQLTIKDMLARMKQSGKQSVNVGAPAFKLCKKVSKFPNKKSFHFEDSENDSQVSSEGEKSYSQPRKEEVKNPVEKELNFSLKRPADPDTDLNTSDNKLFSNLPKKKLKTETGEYDSHKVSVHSSNCNDFISKDRAVTSTKTARKSFLNTPCPICLEMVPFSLINNHVDECLSLKAIRDSHFD